VLSGQARRQCEGRISLEFNKPLVTFSVRWRMPRRGAHARAPTSRPPIVPTSVAHSPRPPQAVSHRAPSAVSFSVSLGPWHAPAHQFELRMPPDPQYQTPGGSPTRTENPMSLSPFGGDGFVGSYTYSTTPINGRRSQRRTRTRSPTRTSSPITYRRIICEVSVKLRAASAHGRALLRKLRRPKAWIDRAIIAPSLGYATGHAPGGRAIPTRWVAVVRDFAPSSVW